MDLLDRVRRSIRRHDLAGPGSRVVAALSGGSDSVALVRLLHQLDELGELKLAGVAHFNHRLRAGADGDEQFCLDLAATLGRPFLADREDVADRARATDTSIEAAAHAARYAFFERARIHFGADAVALGHTKDDQAETVLLRLLRGSGPAGLAGMHPRHDAIVRPLIECRRTDLAAWLHEHGQAFIHDETNDDVSIPRNRVRLELLPVLGRFNPAIVEVLADEADIAREIWRWMEAETAELAPRVIENVGDGTWRIDAAALIGVPLALARSLVHTAMTQAARGRTVSLGHVDAALDLIRKTGSGSIDAPGQRVERVGSHVVLRSRPEGLIGRWVRNNPNSAENFFSCPLSIPGEVVFPPAGSIVSAEEAPSADVIGDAVLGNGRVVAIPRSRPQGGLSVRNRRPGDRFRPLGMTGAKKLQDFLVDRKVARNDRDSVPLVVDGNDRIIWVAGHALDEEFRVTKATEPVIVLRLK